jgi:hypothetical protein
MALKYKYVEVKIMDLLLDVENPRFASSELVRNSGHISQEIVIEHLVKYAKVAELANRINSVQELHGSELITCYEKNGKYIVLEGNRRVCACKLLLNNDLIPDKDKSKFSLISKETKENIETVIINLYPNRESVQSYLSDRHIKGVEAWSSFEKQNYYMNLYNEFKDLKKVATFTTDSTITIKKAIIKYQFFMDIFNALKSVHEDISIENMDYLPLVNRFMSTMLGNDPNIGLELRLDENTLKYNYDSKKKDVYTKILILIGEAFLLRKDRARTTDGELSKVVATELNTHEERRKLIIDDVRIPGLYNLIKEYKGTLDIVNSNDDLKNDPISKDINSLGKENKNDNEKKDKEKQEGCQCKDDDVHRDNIGENKDNAGSGKGSGRDEELNGTSDNNDDKQKYTPPNQGFRPPKTPQNYLSFTEQEASKFKIFGDTNYEFKIRSLISDLRSFPIYKHPYTCALLYRTLLESTCKLVFERYEKKMSFKYAEDRLVDNLIYLNDNFLFNNCKDKEVPKIKKAIKKNFTTHNIVDILNLYVHYGYQVDVALLLSSWNTMKEFIIACLEK